MNLSSLTTNAVVLWKCRVDFLQEEVGIRWLVQNGTREALRSPVAGVYFLP